MKRWVPILLLVLGCAKSRPADEVVFAVDRLPIMLDPRFAIDTASENAIELIFNGLTQTNNHFEVVPDLAESFEAVDAKTYRFKLKAGVKFQDGSPLQVSDVIKTFSFLTDSANASPYRIFFKMVDRIDSPDERTVIVHLNEPYAFFPLMAGRRPILKDGGVDPKNPIGTGPFRFLEMSEGGGVKLKSNSDFFGGAPKVPNVKLKAIQDANVRVLELLKGGVDVVQGTSESFPPGSLERLKAMRTIQLSEGPSANVKYMNFRLTPPILDKLKVRQAFAHAIDREAIVRYKLGGYGEVAHTLIPPTHWAHEKDVIHYDFDPSKAKSLLDEAGYKDPDGDGPKMRFSVVYKTSTDPQVLEIAEVIKSNLEAVGIGVELKTMDFGVLFDDIKKGNFDFYTLQWTSVLSPDHYYEVFHSKNVPPIGNNRNHYANAELDRLLELGRQTIDPVKQKKIYSDAQKIVARDLPALPLWFPSQVSAVRYPLAGYELNPRGTYASLQSVVFRRE